MSRSKSKVLIPAFSAAVISCGAFAPDALANVVGVLDVGSAGTVTVTSNTITFTPTADNLSTTTATTLTYNSGTSLGSGVLATVLPLTGSPNVPNFISFPSIPALGFNLSSVGPGVSNTTCSGLAVGGSCSVFAGSPFILIDTTTGTEVTLAVAGTAHDSTSTTSTWGGLFTAQLAGMTPAQIQAVFAPGGAGSITSSFSGDFTAVIGATSVPEPNTALLLGAALVGALTIVRRRRRS